MIGGTNSSKSVFSKSNGKMLVKAVAVSSVLILAGCGTTPGDRMLSGGMLGAAGGTIIGAATGNWATGAAIGAVSGAAIGALTNPCDLNLGTPYWKRHGGRRAYQERCERPRT
jgi:osmotically inducible lipoprotein OsmB